ncbi:hypothetical protein H0H92_011341 [Tricholoma furcatifolium]|nr:hypothetical protein H0H92_011341 [Tricholoma furcatifolium]
MDFPGFKRALEPSSAPPVPEKSLLAEPFEVLEPNGSQMPIYFMNDYGLDPNFALPASALSDSLFSSDIHSANGFGQPNDPSLQFDVCFGHQFTQAEQAEQSPVPSFSVQGPANLDPCFNFPAQYQVSESSSFLLQQSLVPSFPVQGPANANSNSEYNFPPELFTFPQFGLSPFEKPLVPSYRVQTPENRNRDFTFQLAGPLSNSIPGPSTSFLTSNDHYTFQNNYDNTMGDSGTQPELYFPQLYFDSNLQPYTPPTNGESTEHISPTPSASPSAADLNATESSSSSSSTAPATARRIRRSFDYLPNIRRRSSYIDEGVLCAKTLRCNWKGCSKPILTQEGNSVDAEIRFQSDVAEHFKKHAKSARGLRCRWANCTRGLQKTTAVRGMVRHLQMHTRQWGHFCSDPNCSTGSTRKDTHKCSPFV